MMPSRQPRLSARLHQVHHDGRPMVLLDDGDIRARPKRGRGDD